jgi:hypothetical protein
MPAAAAPLTFRTKVADNPGVSESLCRLSARASAWRRDPTHSGALCWFRHLPSFSEADGELRHHDRSSAWSTPDDRRRASLGADKNS